MRFWRVAAIIAAALALGALGFRSFGRPVQAPHIARLAITGVITGDEQTMRLLADVTQSSAAAVILEIDSPGGTTEGSERLYEAIRKLAAKKPVAAVVGSMAASGAYIAALGADRIFAHGTSIVGSIGVLIEFPNVSGLMDKLGVKLESIKSSPLKASPNGMEPTSEEARAAIAALIADSFEWFKDLVKERRAMSADELAKVADGRVFTGRQGLPLKLIDEVGGEAEAVAWMEAKRGVAKDLKVEDWKPPSNGRLGFLGFSAALADYAGMAKLSGFLRSMDGAASAGEFAGLMSIWQVSH